WGWKLFWRWTSRRRPGRPRLSLEIRELIARIARDNPSWGAERIRGELLKLGIAVSRASVQQSRRRGPARPPGQGWRTFLRNHRPGIWAADLLIVQTLTFRTLYVFVFISHARRELGVGADDVQHDGQHPGGRRRRGCHARGRCRWSRRGRRHSLTSPRRSGEAAGAATTPRTR